VLCGKRNLTEGTARDAVSKLPGIRFEWLMAFDDIKTDVEAMLLPVAEEIDENRNKDQAIRAVMNAINFQIVRNFSLRLSHEELLSLHPAERHALLNSKYTFSNETYLIYDLYQPYFILDDKDEKIATLTFEEHAELIEDVHDFAKIKINRLIKNYKEEIENG